MIMRTVVLTLTFAVVVGCAAAAYALIGGGGPVGGGYASANDGWAGFSEREHDDDGHEGGFGFAKRDDD